MKTFFFVSFVFVEEKTHTRSRFETVAFRFSAGIAVSPPSPFSQCHFRYFRSEMCSATVRGTTGLLERCCEGVLSFEPENNLRNGFGTKQQL